MKRNMGRYWYMMKLDEQAVFDFECVAGIGVRVRVKFFDEGGELDVSGWRFKCGVRGPWVEKVVMEMVAVGGNVAELMWDGMSEGRYVYDVVGVNGVGDNVALLRGGICAKACCVDGGRSGELAVVEVTVPSEPSGAVDVTVRGQGEKGEPGSDATVTREAVREVVDDVYAKVEDLNAKLSPAEADERYGKLAGANEWSGVQTIYAPDGKYGANKIIQIRDASGEYPGYNICFRNGGSLEIFDESQDPTRHEPYFQIWRPGGNRTYACNNFCVKGTTEMRGAVTLKSTSSLTANCPATFKGAVTFTQAPVLSGMFAGDANSVSNAYSALGLALLSPMWVQTAYFNNVTVKAGTANISKTVGVRGQVHWSTGNASVSEMAFIPPSAESNIYGGLEGFWQPIHFYTNEGWVKVSFGLNSSMLTSAEYTVSDFVLNEKDVFVYAPTAVQSNSFNGYVDITFMRTSSAKTTVRTRLLKKASNSSTWYLEEQVAEIPFGLAGWGSTIQGFGGARNAEKNKVLFFVHHGPAIYKVAEFESPWLIINESNVNFALSAGDLAETDYSYTTIENQRIYMRADLFGGKFACPFFEVLNNCASNVITTITEPVVYEPVSSDVE